MHACLNNAINKHIIFIKYYVFVRGNREMQGVNKWAQGAGGWQVWMDQKCKGNACAQNQAQAARAYDMIHLCKCISFFTLIIHDLNSTSNGNTDANSMWCAYHRGTELGARSWGGHTMTTAIMNTTRLLRIINHNTRTVRHMVQAVRASHALASNIAQAARA
jgi:hypothetical protein